MDESRVIGTLVVAVIHTPWEILNASIQLILIFILALSVLCVKMGLQSTTDK